MDNDFVNKEYCTKCGGYCCKKSGCDYFVEDFEDLSYKAIENILSEGNISIVSYLNFEKLKSGKMIVTPFLYLRARNTGKDIVDLLSIKTTCSMLTETGCTYSINERPSGGVNLIPGPTRFDCHPKENVLDKLQEWERFQKPLSKFIKRYCNMSVEEKLNEDIENLFYDCLCGKLDEAAIEEQADISSMLPTLIETNPVEFQNASMKYQNKKYNLKIKK